MFKHIFSKLIQMKAGNWPFIVWSLAMVAIIGACIVAVAYFSAWLIPAFLLPAKRTKDQIR